MSNPHSRQHAVIIGASSGIGAVSALRLSSKYNISGLSRRGVLPTELSTDISKAYECDATSIESLKSTLHEAVEHFGKISLLLISAGMQLIKPVRSMKAEEIHAVIMSNLAMPMQVASLFASQRFSNPDAVLCMLSSIASARPEPGIVLYAATKAALENMIAGLAKELAPRRVVGISPGWLDTPMTQAYSHVYTPEFIDSLKNRSPLGIADVNDIVDAIEFLSSSSAKKITGQVLVVDGGASL